MNVRPFGHYFVVAGSSSTVLQDGQFAALKERQYLLLEIFMILTNFKPKKSPFWPFLLEKLSKNHEIKIGDFGCKKSSKFEENLKINNYSLVPQN